MKLVYTILFFFSLAVSAQAPRDYYFSSVSGNDNSGNGTIGAPYATLGKANALAASLNPGDHVLFKRGENFIGSLNFSRSGTAQAPIIFDAYGTGAKPSFNSFFTLASWTNTGGNIWASSQTVANRLNVVLVGGYMRDRGRYPNLDNGNGGFLNYESHNGYSSITDNNPPTPVQNWVGAEISMRTVRWMLNTYQITNQSNGTYFFNGNQGEIDPGPFDGFGYFIQNHLGTLDQQNEWYYSGTTLQMYSTVNPATLGVKVATLDTLVQVHNSSYITFQNITFQGANRCLINVLQSDHIIITNSDALYCGGTSIKVDQSTYCSATYDYVKGSSYRAIDFTINANYGNISNNTVDSSSMLLTLCGNGNLANIALFGQGTNLVIENNTVTHTAYNGANVTGSYASIRYNNIDGYCLMFDDGAGIYTSGPGLGRVFRNNHIANGVGNFYGTSNGVEGTAANGIGLDDYSENVIIDSNTIENNSREGIGIHNTHDVVMTHNVIWNNRQKGFGGEHDANGYNSPIYGVVFKHNIIYSNSQLPSINPYSNDYYNSLLFLATRRDYADLLNFGTSDSNLWIKPAYLNRNDFFKYRYRYVPQGDVCNNCNTDDSTARYAVTVSGTLEDWQRIIGQDLHSRTIDMIRPYVATPISGELYPNGNFNSNINDVRNANTSNQTLSFVPNGINGGSLKAQYIGNNSQDDFSALLYNEAGLTIQAGHVYVVTLQIQCTGGNNIPFEATLVSDGGPGTGGQDSSKPFSASVYRSNVELRFNPSVTRTYVYLRVETKDHNALTAGSFLIDNVSIRDVTLTQTDLSQYSTLLVNPTNSPMTFTLNKPYTDAAGNALPRTVTVPRYYSLPIIADKNAIQYEGLIVPTTQ